MCSNSYTAKLIHIDKFECDTTRQLRNDGGVGGFLNNLGYVNEKCGIVDDWITRDIPSQSRIHLNCRFEKCSW
jgi:hypothetical protein